MECPFTVEQLDHILLPVRDVEKSMAFYRMLSGGAEARGSGPNKPVPFGPVTRILLQHDPDYVRQPKGNVDHMAIVLTGADSIEQVMDYVRAHGVEPFDGPIDRGEGFVQFRVRDPDDNEIEVRVRLNEAAPIT
jgi:catechol 2,3-dioxygenase-like lactoylglutathione lyase family enzyme